jgi:anti-sigma regulatory factor (Ser/Thr protein kinase)
MHPRSSRRIVLPERLTLSLASEGPESGDWAWEEVEDIQLEASRPISHAEPAALALLAAWSAHQRARGCTVHIGDSVKSPYAWKYGLLATLAGRMATSNPDPFFFFPSTAVHSPEEHAALFNRLSPLLHALSQKQREVLLHCLAEMLRNVDEHASSPVGAYVCCSHFPKTGRLSMAIVDTGVGIPTTIRNRYSTVRTDEQAIDWATQWKVSGSTATANNGGFGLFIARSTTRDTGGLFTVVSGRGMVRSSREEESVSGNPRALWQGTIVALSFRSSLSQEAWTRTNQLLSSNPSNGALPHRARSAWKSRPPPLGSSRTRRWPRSSERPFSSRSFSPRARSVST